MPNEFQEVLIFTPNPNKVDNINRLLRSRFQDTFLEITGLTQDLQGISQARTLIEQNPQARRIAIIDDPTLSPQDYTIHARALGRRLNNPRLNVMFTTATTNPLPTLQRQQINRQELYDFPEETFSRLLNLKARQRDPINVVTPENTPATTLPPKPKPTPPPNLKNAVKRLINFFQNQTS